MNSNVGLLLAELRSVTKVCSRNTHGLCRFEYEKFHLNNILTEEWKQKSYYRNKTQAPNTDNERTG